MKQERCGLLLCRCSASLSVIFFQLEKISLSRKGNLTASNCYVLVLQLYHPFNTIRAFILMHVLTVTTHALLSIVPDQGQPCLSKGLKEICCVVLLFTRRFKMDACRLDLAAVPV